MSPRHAEEQRINVLIKWKPQKGRKVSWFVGLTAVLQLGRPERDGLREIRNGEFQREAVTTQLWLIVG